MKYLLLLLFTTGLTFANDRDESRETDLFFECFDNKAESVLEVYFDRKTKTLDFVTSLSKIRNQSIELLDVQVNAIEDDLNGYLINDQQGDATFMLEEGRLLLSRHSQAATLFDTEDSYKLKVLENDLMRAIEERAKARNSKKRKKASKKIISVNGEINDLKERAKVDGISKCMYYFSDLGSNLETGI